jgi:hypothetical protein
LNGGGQHQSIQACTENDRYSFSLVGRAGTFPGYSKDTRSLHRPFVLLRFDCRGLNTWSHRRLSFSSTGGQSMISYSLPPQNTGVKRWSLALGRISQERFENVNLTPSGAINIKMGLHGLASAQAVSRKKHPAGIFTSWSNSGDRTSIAAICRPQHTRKRGCSGRGQRAGQQERCSLQALYSWVQLEEFLGPNNKEGDGTVAVDFRSGGRAGQCS